MILYNVTIKLEESIQAEWLQWMKEKHIPDVMATGMFSEYRLCRMLSRVDDEDSGETYVTQYVAANMENLIRYDKEFAPILRADLQNRFGGKFGAFRSVMEIL